MSDQVPDGYSFAITARKAGVHALYAVAAIACVWGIDALPHVHLANAYMMAMVPFVQAGLKAAINWLGEH